MNIIKTIEAEKCCGCSACMNVCTTQCIVMEQSDEGFLIPHVDKNTCIQCGVCVNHCPVLMKNNKKLPKSAYAAISKNSEKTLRSSSGGAFFEIAEHFIIDVGGYVCGCVMDDDYFIHHIVTNNCSDLTRMQGSKYVQSNITQVLPQIREIINDGIPVLFSGTPCQVEAVRIFIGEAEKLYTVDIVCHGVTSPIVFKRYMENAYCDAHLDSFRYKNPYEISTYAFSFTNGKRVRGQMDPFYNSFLKGQSFRESCYSCKFACPERVGDITLGDCANFRAYPTLAGNPISTVLVNTAKGDQIWVCVKDQMKHICADYTAESRLNHQLNSPASRPEERSVFYSDFETMSASDFSKKYAEHWNTMTRIKRFLISHIPYEIRSKIRRSL